MEAVTPDPLGGKFARQGEAVATAARRDGRRCRSRRSAAAPERSWRRRDGARDCAAGAAAPAESADELGDHRGVDAQRRGIIACRHARRGAPTATSRLVRDALGQPTQQRGERVIMGRLPPASAHRPARAGGSFARKCARGRCPRSRPCIQALPARRACREDRELEARRAGVEDQDTPSLMQLSAAASVAGAPAAAAMAQDASRASALSARLVRMIGTRAPSTMPAASRPARYSSCLASMLPASRSGTTQDVGLAGDRRDDALGLRGLLADGVVERQRPVEHAAA